MKRMSCLLLGLVAMNAAAAPAQSWIELEYGDVNFDEYPSSPHAGIGAPYSPRETGGEKDELVALSAAWASSSTLYWRVDHRNMKRETDLGPVPVGTAVDYDETVLVTADTRIDADTRVRLKALEITTLTAGARLPLSQNVDLLPEIGLARVHKTESGIVYDYHPTRDEVLAIRRALYEQEKTSVVLRLGFEAAAGRFLWGGGFDHYTKYTPERGTDRYLSALWLNAFAGYRITPNWRVRLSYSALPRKEFEDEIQTTAISVRWTP